MPPPSVAIVIPTCVVLCVGASVYCTFFGGYGALFGDEQPQRDMLEPRHEEVPLDVADIELDLKEE